MFNQIVGGYQNQDKIDITNTKSRDFPFRGNHVIPSPNIKYQSDTIAPDYAPPDLKIRNNVIIINSLDRNWYNYPNETPFKYLVKLGGTGTDQYLTVGNNYKNVVAFSIDKIILPNRPAIQSYNSNISPRLNNNPYLTLTVKGINYSSYGTNRVLNETIGIYTPLIPLPLSLSEIAYLEFKNTSIQRKEYTPAPEGYISVLDLAINNPIGTLASNLNDVLGIYSIYLNTNTSNATPLTINDSLVIQTNTYFTDNEFRQNDLIQIKNYSYHNPSFDESGIFNNWINNSNGHYISNIDKSNPATTLYNKIIIPFPGSLDTTTGNIAVESWFSSFVMKSLSNVAIQDNGGKLINVNTQSHLVVNIKTVEKNDNLFFKDLV